MERGFKTYANNLVLQVRGELRLSPTQPLDPWVLAEYLGIPTEPLSSFIEDAPLAARVFRTSAKSSFSAVTVHDGTAGTLPTTTITHTAGRRAALLMNLPRLLMHEPAPALDVRGLVVHRSEIEDQATFMGAALLVPEEAALSIVARAVAFTEAASYYGVSLELLRWRINSTGASLRVARSRQLRAQPRPFRSVTGRSPRGNTTEARTRAAD